MIEIIKGKLFESDNSIVYCITDDSVPLKQGDQIMIRVKGGTMGWFYISNWRFSASTDVERRKVLLAYEIRNKQ